MDIETIRLRLVPKTLDEVRAEIEQMDPEQRAELSADWLARICDAASPDHWTLGFSLVLRQTGAVVGSCGFKGPPDPDGVVEIAYGIAPAHQNKGYATEAAGALLDFAIHSGQVRVVRAHTLEQVNASTRVLAKCGFLPVGPVIDPEDGLVWRWEKHGAP